MYTPPLCRHKEQANPIPPPGFALCVPVYPHLALVYNIGTAVSKIDLPEYFIIHFAWIETWN